MTERRHTSWESKFASESRTVTQLQHNSKLTIEEDVQSALRVNGIICTIGPNTQTVPALKELIQCGMNVVRLNFSHGSHEFHQKTIDNARQAAQETGVIVAIALDTKGPEIRTGIVKGGGDIQYKIGDKVKVSVNIKDKSECSRELLYCDYTNLPKKTKVGGKIFVDDGLMSLEVEEVGEDFCICKVLNNATISDHKGVNLPDTEVDLPAVSEKVKGDLLFAVKNNLDMIFASFIRSAGDVQQVRDAMGPGGKDIQIISKIENHQGLRNFPEIIKVSDGVMVARGDLGIEIPPEKVFLAQKMMIAQCNMAGKPVICATQMLESMTFNPRPTRAEVTDVANAVLDGADCVMLSGETAKGKYPNQSVTMMSRICKEAQFATSEWQYFQQVKLSQTEHHQPEEYICVSAVNTAYDVQAPAIIVLTNTGNSARLLAKYRPRCPIYAVTNNDRVARQLHITRACFPVFVEQKLEKTDYDARIAKGLERARADGVVMSGDRVVVVHAYADHKGGANMIRVLDVE